MQTVIHQAVILPCEASEAYCWFTENSRLESWLAAKADVEPVLGGKYELFWNPEDPAHNSTRGCRVTAIAPHRLLAFDWRGAEEHEAFMDAADPWTHVTVSFIPTSEGTEVHLVHTGWRKGPEWNQARLWFERAWSMAFEELTKVVSSARTRG